VAGWNWDVLQDGMLKNKSTYEIIEPSKVGIYRAEGEAGIVMGKHSGRHALKTRMMQLGVDLDGDELMEVCTLQRKQTANSGAIRRLPRRATYKPNQGIVTTEPKPSTQLEPPSEGPVFPAAQTRGKRDAKS
jgi:isopropylmalate/homocitrate/citramalate synthase